MRVLVTGVAGFIGYHVARALLARGAEVMGVDNLNDYYDVTLKQTRLEELSPHPRFSFLPANIADRQIMLAFAAEGLTHIVHLAAQAGVRHSLENPFSYAESNLMGQVVMLEVARHSPQLKHFVYASSSSVYGGNSKIPFSVSDPVTKPISLYAATKRADELMGYTYAHLYKIPMTGLRFFTVYGPWGRPDMATYIFTRRILAGEPIKVFNNGNMRRDFTYIDDAVKGVIAALDRPPMVKGHEPPIALYNIGNSKAEPLMRFIEVLEKTIGKRAIIDMQPMQPGDVVETFADISSSSQDLGFSPRISIEEGLPRFVDWYRGYHNQKVVVIKRP